MANRFLAGESYALIKRQVDIYAAFSVGETGTPTLLKWNYPTFAAGPNKFTYTAANTTSTALPTGAPYPIQYENGSEGVRSVARTATGLWTITFQDNFQRMVMLQGFTRIAGGAAKIVGFNENTTITNMSAAGGSIVGVSMVSSTATLADPQTTETILLTFTFADSSTP